MGSKRAAGIVLFGNWVVGRGRRIEDRRREDPLPLGQRRNHAESRDARPLPRALPIGEEKRLVGLQRTAQSQAVLVAAELRLRPRLREQVARIERLVAEEFERRCRAAGCCPISRSP